MLADPTLAPEIAALRADLPTVDSARFMALPQLKEGAEAQVFHDRDGDIVYKSFKVRDGKTGAFVPGAMRMAEDGHIRIVAGPRPTFNEFLQRMARVNAHGELTPMEFMAVTPDGYAVFAQPFIAGRKVSDANAESALRRVGLHVITQIGGVAAVGKVEGRWVLFDDLHSGNVKTAPGGGVEVIDAINRWLTEAEVHQLERWGRLPKEAVGFSVNEDE